MVINDLMAQLALYLFVSFNQSFGQPQQRSVLRWKSPFRKKNWSRKKVSLDSTNVSAG